MANTSSMVKTVAVCMAAVVVCMVVRGPQAVESAVTCGGVVSSLKPCTAYLKGSVTLPPANCCGGVRSLKGMAQTPVDRKTACRCMKTAAAKFKGLSYGNANKLPTQCGVSIRYTFTPNVNCDTVQ